mgnify:CR=1 FL=1
MTDALTKVLNYAYDHHIGVETHNDWPADWPSLALPSKHMLLLNLNWGRRDEVPFIAAHEIGHVLNGDTGKLYFHNDRMKSDAECNADRTGIRVLYEICTEDEDFDPAFFNPLEFMVNFKIPACYRDYVCSLC